MLGSAVDTASVTLGPMRSVVDGLRQEERDALLKLSAGERVRLALVLGERDLETFRKTRVPPLTPGEARRQLERGRQRGRRPSRALEALIG